jgi:hypothetical protein
MSRGPASFKQRDVKAAIKAAVAAGFQIGRVEVAQDGRIILIAGTGQPIEPANPWDAVTKDLRQ